MPSFSHQLSVDLDVPPAAAWAVIADYRRDPEWREGVRMTVEPAGPVVDGTTTREQLRMFGSWQQTTAHIRDVAPGRGFRFVSEDGSVEGTRTLEPTARGTRVTVWLRVAVPRALAPLAGVLGWLFRRRVRRDLARLRGLVVAAHQPSVTVAPTCSTSPPNR